MNTENDKMPEYSQDSKVNPEIKADSNNQDINKSDNTNMENDKMPEY